jgi:aspartyl protease family protein
MSSSSHKTIGRGMIIAAWIGFAALLTFLFQDVLDRQWNPNQDLAATSAEEAAVVLDRNRFGHYVATGSINGEPVEFLLDTGATHVSVPASLADRLGLKRGAPAQVSTANGVIRTWRTVIDEVALGPIVLRDVPAGINPAMDGDLVLLGMSVLKHLDLEQRGGTLRISRPDGP